MTEVILTIECPFCETEHEVVVYEEQLAEYWGWRVGSSGFSTTFPNRERANYLSFMSTMPKQSLWLVATKKQ